MKIVCAWCKKEMGEKEPLGDKSISHTICRECSIEYLGVDPVEGKKVMKTNHEPKKVTILKNTSTCEYRVPGPAGTEAQAYYTDDKRDAIGTAQHMYGKDIQIGFRGVPDFDRFLKENPIEYGTGLEKVKQKLKHLWDYRLTREEKRKILIATGHIKPTIGGFTETEYDKFYHANIVDSKFDNLPAVIQDILIGSSHKFIKENPGAAWHEKQSIDHARMSNLSKDPIIKSDHAGQAYAHEYSAKKAKELGINPKLSMQQAGEIYDSLGKPDRFEILTAADIHYYNINQVLHMKFKSLPLQIQQKVTNLLDSLSNNPRKSKQDRAVKELRKTVTNKWNSMIQYDRIPWVLHANITKTEDVAARIAFFSFRQLGDDVKQALIDSYNDYWKKYKKNPGANWHTHKMIEARTKRTRFEEQGRQTRADIETGKELAHSESIKQSDILGMNPHQSFHVSDQDIESVAIELYTQGHGVGDVSILLQKEFDISKKEAEYFAKRAARISRGKTKRNPVDTKDLRLKVLEKGRTTKDKRTVKDLYPILKKLGNEYTLSMMFTMQMQDDLMRGYKFYDALGMWLGQSKHWTDADNEFLALLAEAYITER